MLKPKPDHDGTRRRSLFERIVRTAEAGNALHLSPRDTKRLAGVLDVARRAAWDEKILDKFPAPMGENPTEWAANRDRREAHDKARLHVPTATPVGTQEPKEAIR